MDDHAAPAPPSPPAAPPPASEAAGGVPPAEVHPAVKARLAQLARQDGAPPPSRAPSGSCVRHPEVAATRMCHRCGAPMCDTCDFAFPGGVHVCPACIENPSSPVSTARNVLAILGLVFSLGALAALLVTVLHLVKLSPTAIAGYFTVLVFLPTLVGFILSLSAMNKRRGNSILLWISNVISLAMVALIVLLIIIGNLKQAGH
jgi:hypothetical protein